MLRLTHRFSLFTAHGRIHFGFATTVNHNSPFHVIQISYSIALRTSPSFAHRFGSVSVIIIKSVRSYQCHTLCIIMYKHKTHDIKHEMLMLNGINRATSLRMTSDVLMIKLDIVYICAFYSTVAVHYLFIYYLFIWMEYRFRMSTEHKNTLRAWRTSNTYSNVWYFNCRFCSGKSQNICFFLLFFLFDWPGSVAKPVLII